MSLSKMINEQEIQNLQDEFCQATGLVIYSLDKEKHKLTKCSGSEEKKEQIKEYIDTRQVYDILYCMQQETSKRPIIEKLADTEGFVAVVAVYMYESVLFYWVVFEVDEKEREEFFKKVTLLAHMGELLYNRAGGKEYQEQIEQQAYTDFLTGLYNRMCFERDLSNQVEEACKNKETGALLYLDLDDFKHINGGLGHQYGDVLLKSISHSLRDIEGIQNTCYRMGGDEFVILIPPKAYSRFQSVVEDIQKLFNKPWFLKDSDYYCTVSIGIVTFPEYGESVADLIKKADIAMYEAKRGGKNRVAKYDNSIDADSGKRLNLETNMRNATADGYREFEIYYQPVIDVQDGKISCRGAEALLRWNSPKLGFVSPVEFITLAEYLGLINPIGSYVLQQACKHCKFWNDNGHPNYEVNVNLSVVQLLQPDIVETVENVLKETGLRPENLTLEVTESLAINDMKYMKKILNQIKDLGVKIALDDFGTGYSSLNHIREIPFDIIKIDRSFIIDLAEDAYSQCFVKMVIELAQATHASICVEGVETAEQYNILKEMQVQYIQGYYFDRPMKRELYEDKYVFNDTKNL